MCRAVRRRRFVKLGVIASGLLAFDSAAGEQFGEAEAVAGHSSLIGALR